MGDLVGFFREGLVVIVAGGFWGEAIGALRVAAR